MALWGNNENVGSGGSVTLNYSTLEVVGTATTFGNTGAAQTGNVIRFGERGTGTYFGDAVIVGIASTTTLTIGSTLGLSGAAISAQAFVVSELPVSSTWDSKYSELEAGTDYDALVYGVSENDVDAFAGVTSAYRASGAGWVGVQTYVDTEGNFRVKSEILVAMSGITTGAIPYPTAE